jgi:hypothetical protein
LTVKGAGPLETSEDAVATTLPGVAGETVICREVSPVLPKESVTVKVTVNVPTVWYVWDGLAPVPD